MNSPGTAIGIILFKQVTPKEACDAVDWPVIAMLGSLIPVGEAFDETSAAQTIARILAQLSANALGLIAPGVVLFAAMLVPPPMHYATAVLVMAPVAAAIANDLGLNIDRCLMAVAPGASCDFLTRIEHQNTTLVKGP